MSSAYRRFIAFNCAFLMAASIGIPTARSQDANIETRIEQYVQPPEIFPPEPTVKTVRKTEIRETPKTLPKSDAEVSKELQQIQSSGDTSVVKSLRTLEMKGLVEPEEKSLLFTQDGTEQVDISKLSPKERAMLLDGIKGKSSFTTKMVRREVTRTTKVAEPPKTKVIASFDSSYEYDSNAFSTPTNTRSDRYLSVVPGVAIVVPTSSTSGFTYVIKGAYARYDEETALDSDVILGVAAYSTTLYSLKKDKRSATKQEEAITFQLVGQGIYDPGFSGSGTKIYTPSLLWELKGLAIGSSLCGSGGARVNCFVAGLSAELGHTWIGSSGADKNARAKLGGSLDWNIRGNTLVWGTTGSITNRYYEDFPGDRNDVFLEIETKLSWKAAGNISLSAGTKYRNQLSSRDELDYEKFLFIPMVKGSMSF